MAYAMLVHKHTQKVFGMECQPCFDNSIITVLVYVGLSTAYIITRG